MKNIAFFILIAAMFIVQPAFACGGGGGSGGGRGGKVAPKPTPNPGSPVVSVEISAGVHVACQLPNIGQAVPGKLEQGTDGKIRFTPLSQSITAQNRAVKRLRSKVRQVKGQHRARTRARLRNARAELAATRQFLRVAQTACNTVNR